MPSQIILSLIKAIYGKIINIYDTKYPFSRVSSAA
jgi:hypothetical protein